MTETLIPDRAICDQYFTFKTVFYRRGASYCCCRCAYDHEYFTYIYDTGDIDLEKFDLLAKAVEIGYCEHAIKVENKEYLKETKVHSIHIASALGIKDMVEFIVITLDRIKHSGLFHLTPSDIGCLKHRENILHLVDKLNPLKRIFHARESKGNVLHIEQTSHFEIRASENNIATLRDFLDVLWPSGNIYYEFLFKFNFNDELKEKVLAMENSKHLEFLDKLKTNYLTLIHPCVDHEQEREINEDFISVGELAVIYNQFDIFKMVTQAYSNSHFHAGYYEVVKVCDAFQRPEFNEFIDLTEMTANSKLECVRHLLSKYKLSGDHIIKDMEQIINQQTGEDYTPLQWYICVNETVEISVTRALIDRGANIDIPLPDSDGKSLLIHILQKRSLKERNFKELIELFLYENISLVMNISAIPMAITRSDEEMQQNKPLIHTGAYILDTTTHENIFASLIPLLIEAGFKYTLSDIMKALQLYEDSSSIDTSLTSSENIVENRQTSVLGARRMHRHHNQLIPQNPVKAYLECCLSEPRPLMLRCRDVLRTHFPRREIHRYVSIMDIPNRIKAFLLLKHILQRPLGGP